MAFKKAESFINECYRSDICLYYSPETLAASALYMASRFLKIDLQDQHFQSNVVHSSWKTHVQNPKNPNTISTDVSMYNKSLRSNKNKMTLNSSLIQTSTTNVTPESREDEDTVKDKKEEQNEENLRQTLSFSLNLVSGKQLSNESNESNEESSNSAEANKMQLEEQDQGVKTNDKTMDLEHNNEIREIPSPNFG